MKPSVYLAGPVSGLTFGEANVWRERVTRVLLPEIQCLNPLRGKEHLVNKSGVLLPSPMDGFCTDEAIVMRDYNDLCRADIVLANLSAPADHPLSIGTLFELAWAWELRKVVVVVGVDEESPYDHPFVRQVVTYVATDMPDALDFIKISLVP